MNYQTDNWDVYPIPEPETPDHKAYNHNQSTQLTNLHIKEHRHRQYNSSTTQTIITQNAQGMMDNDIGDRKLKSIIFQMKTNNWSAMCIQETWRTGKETFYINGYLIVMQGHNKRDEEADSRGHVNTGVCIILNPICAQAHIHAAKHTITLPTDHEFEGRFLGLSLSFQDYDNNGKKLKRNTNFTLCSLYPVVNRK